MFDWDRKVMEKSAFFTAYPVKFAIEYLNLVE